MPPALDPEVLLFDLGGVIVDVASLAEIQSMLATPLDLAQVAGRWPAMDAWEAFELGKLTPAEFARRFVDEFPLSVTPAVFLDQFESWNRRLLPGVTELLPMLRPRYRLAALSNTNALHWRRLVGEFGIGNLFDRLFASHRIGLRKPGPGIYAHVLRELGVAADHVVFFDDNEANVEGARLAGLGAYRVTGIGELRARLEELGCLADQP